MLSEEEKKAIENLKTEYEKLIKEDNILFPLYKSDAKRLIDIIEKQSKEIELLKEENEKYKNPPFFDEDKYTENDKIKAKIEEYKHKDFIKMQVVWKHDKEALKIAEVLQSLLEKE